VMARCRQGLIAAPEQVVGAVDAIASHAEALGLGPKIGIAEVHTTAAVHVVLRMCVPSCLVL
jgi:hypothetical protein